MKSLFGISMIVAGLMVEPMTAGAQIQVVTTLAPPSPMAETPPPSPGPGFVWVAGFWAWNGARHIWTAGHWEQPPQPAQTWEAPRWEPEGRQYRFHPGRWRQNGGVPVAQPVQTVVPVAQPVVPVAQPVQTVVPTEGIVVAPPRMRAERPPRVLPNGQIWVPGFWSWNGSQHVWTPGHVEAPPHPGGRWVAPRWERRGRNWGFTPGRWR